VKQLAPFYLRLGGSLQDHIEYEAPPGVNTGATCAPLAYDTTAQFNFSGGCLSMARWKELTSLCADAGCKVIFGLNGLLGRTRVQGKQWTGQWNPEQARALLKYTKDNEISVYAWELGNELGGWNGIAAQLTPEVS
jgi:heparanase